MMILRVAMILCLAAFAIGLQEVDSNPKLNSSTLFRRIRRSTQLWKFDTLGLNLGHRRRFDKQVLSWRIGSFFSNSDLSDDDVRHVIRSALRAWSDVIAIRFQEMPSSDSWSTVDIKFLFDSGSFQANTVARFESQENYNLEDGVHIHFNEDVDWVIGNASPPSVDLFTVALHQIGHALGLGHSRMHHDVMSTTYTRRMRRLTNNDIQAVQALYGSGGGGRPRIPNGTRCTPGQSYCGQQLIDLGHRHVHANSLYRCNGDGYSSSLDSACSQGCTTINLDSGCTCVGSVWYCIREQPPMMLPCTHCPPPPPPPDNPTSASCQLYSEKRYLDAQPGATLHHSYCRNPSAKCQMYCGKHTLENGRWIPQRYMSYTNEGEKALITVQ